VDTKITKSSRICEKIRAILVIPRDASSQEAPIKSSVIIVFLGGPVHPPDNDVLPIANLNAGFLFNLSSDAEE